MSCLPCASAIGNLMYVIGITRPNISHVVDVVNRHMENLGKEN